MANLAELNARIEAMSRAAAEKQGKLKEFEEYNRSVGLTPQTSPSSFGVSTSGSSSGKSTTQKTQTSTGSTGADAIAQAMSQRAEALAARVQELNRLQEDLNRRYAALQSGQSTETAEQLALEQDRLNDRKVNYERDSAQYGIDAAYYDQILAAAPYIAVERQAEETGTSVSGGVQAMIDTMQQRVNQIDQRRKSVQEEQAAIEERVRLLQHNTALSEEERAAERTAINQAVARLTGRQQNLMRDAGIYSEDARAYDDALIERAEQDMMDFAQRQMDAYYDEAAMQEAYEGQRAALYAEWQELQSREQISGIYGDRTASDVWSEIQNLEDSYQRQRVEAENYWTERELEKLSDSERKLVEDYVEAVRTKGTSESGRYVGTEEVESLWSEMARTFGTQRARELVQWGERAYDAEQQAKRNEKLKEYAGKGVGQAIAASAASVITNFASAPGALVEIVRQTIDNPNNLQTLNVNAPGFEAQNATRSFRSGVTESIMPDEENATVAQKTGVMLYSSIMSGIDSLVSSRLPGKWGVAVLVGTAASNTAQDVTERGGTVNQALLGGVAAGAFEMIFESISIGQLKGMEEAENVRNIKTYLMNVAKSVGTNASEEAATEMANILFDMVALGDVSAYQMQLQELMAGGMSESEAKRELAGALAMQVVESGVSGALMGGMFGVFGNTVAMKNTKAKDRVYNELLLDGLIDQGLTYERTTAFELAASLQIRRNENEVIPHEEITALMEQVQNEVNRRAESGAGIAEATNAEATEQMMGLPEQVRQIEEQMQAAPEIQETMQEETAREDMRREEAVPMVQEAVREENHAGNIPARAEAENAAEGITEENTLRQDAVEDLRRLSEEYKGVELQVAAQNLANDMRMAGETAYAEEIEAVAAEMVTAPAAVSENDVRTAPVSAVQTEGVQYGGAETTFDGGRERDAGAYTGGTSGILGERADGRKKRSSQNKRAAQRQTRVHDLRAERVSAKSLGLAQGSDLENVTVVPEAAWDGELQATAERVWQEAGLEVQYILGKIRLETDAGTRYAKGAIVDGKIIIQADNLRYTVDQIADHEMFHDIARGNRGLVSAIREEIQERYSREEYERIVERYLEAYAGVYENDEDLMRKIAEEIFADAYAGINEFSERVETYRGVVREITDRRTGRLGDRGTPETRAGPENDAAIKPTDTAGEVAFSLANDERYMENARKKNNGVVSKRNLDRAERARTEIREIFRNQSEGLNLPEDVTGNTFVKDSAYGGSEENTTVCIRSLAADDLMDAIAEYINRPLTVQDTLKIAQEYWKYTDKPECLYCYVAMDRKAQREYLGEYLKQRDAAIRDFENGVGYDEAYERFRGDRTNTGKMRERFAMFYQNWQSGAETITPAMLASPKRIQETAKDRLELRKQINDALQYAQNASWAKKRMGYRAYNNHILRWGAAKVAELNRHYGLRLYSFSDFSPAFILENMQMLTDAAVKDLKVLGYTKELDFVRIFAPSGMNINVSVFGYDDGEGGVAQDAMQGADWAEAQELRRQYPNVGCTFVATNDSQIEWALDQDWIDVIIPFHMVKTGSKVAQEFGWTNYTQMSADLKSDEWTENDARTIYPEEHGNDKATYLNAIRENHLKPRFEKWVDHPNYMKLVNETRRSAKDTPSVQPIFNVDAAKESIEKMRKMGGYYTPVGGSREVMREIAEEIGEKIDGDADVRFSIEAETDSDGNELSEEQAEYFADSAVRDEEGNLMVVYHGTNAEFSIFRTDYRGAIWATDSKNIAEGFDKSGGKKVIPMYANIKNPLRKEFNVSDNWDIDAVVYEAQTGEYDGVIINFTINTNNDYLQFLYHNSPDALASEYVDNVRGAGLWIQGETIKEYMDRVKNGSHKYIVGFDSSQFKRTDNRKPTGDPDIRFSIDADTDSPAAEAKQIWEELRGTYGTGAILDGVVNGRIQELREQGETETATVLNRIWRTAEETVAPATEYDDRGERWTGEVQTIGEAEERLWTEVDEERLREAREQAKAEREERLRLVTRENFTATPAVKKLGVRIEGSVADYGKAESLRRNDAAAKETRRQIARAERRINATAKEKEFASGLAAGVYDLEDIPNTMSPDHVVELADLYSESRSLGLDMIKERRREINGQLDEVMQELFHDSEQYEPMTAMQLYHNTPQRIMQKIFGDKLGDRINREIFDPVARNEAERLRFMNRQFARVRTFQDSKGRRRGLSRAESALTQQIIEGRAVAEQVAALEMKGAIEDAAEQLRKGGVIGEIMEKFGLGIGDGKTVERYARWLDAQEAMKSGKVDAVKVENAADEYRKIFDEYYEAINDFLVVHGYEPIGFIKGYAPHMQSDESKDLLEKALKTLGIQTEVAALPTTIAGLTSEYKPGKRWNPYFLTRHGDQTDYDIESAFESYVNYMSDVLYHTDDIMRVRRMSRYFRKSYSPEEIKGNIDWAESLRYAPTEDKQAFLRDMKVLDYGTVLSAEEAEQRMEAFIEGEFQKITENTKFGDLVSWLDNYANILAGKQSVADRGFEAQYGRKLLNWGRRVSAMFSRANVAGNISSALNQSAQLPQIVAENGTINTLKAIGDIIGGKVRKAGFAEESDFLTGKRGVGFLVTKPGDMVTTALFKPAEFVDGMLSTMAVRGAYHKAVRQGMSHEEAMRKADRTGQSIMASRVKGVKPMAFESKNFLAQMVNMFQVEALNSWQHLAQDLPRDFRDIAETKGRGKAAMALSGVVVKTILGAFLMNRMTDELYGGTPAPFDLVGMSANFIASGEGLVVNEMLRMLIDNVFEDLFGERPFETERRDPDERQEFDWDAAWKDLWYEVSNEIPYLSNLSGLLGWGDQTLPLPDVYGNVENLITAIKNAGWVSAETGEAVIKLIGEFFPGGRQMTKTAQGVKVMLEGGRYYGYGDNRRLQYPVEWDAENWIKAVLFGYSSLSETNNFYASGVNGLSAKQTKVYEELTGTGYDSDVLYETLLAYNAAEDSKGERAAITAADLTDRQKLNLYTKLKGDSREEEFVKLMNAGLSWAETMEAYDEYTELYNTEGINATEKATRYAMWVDEQGYDDKQTALIKDELKFFNMAPAEAGNYEKFSAAGLSIKESFDLATTFADLEPEEGKEQVSNMQKYRAIVASGMDENEQLKAIGAIMGTDMLTESGEPSQYAKMLDILDDGTTITEYLDLKDADHVDAYLKAREKGIELETYVDLSEAKQVDNYLEAVELGLSKDSAYKAVMAVAALPELPEGESYGEKDRQLAAVKACESVNDQILAYAAYGDKQYVESTVKKLTDAYEACGLTPEHYAIYRINTKSLDAKDANAKTVTNLKKARVIMAIDRLDLSVEQKNYLFDMAGYKGRGEALWNINRKFDSAEAYAKWL